jgi:uncharacterized integral membrane protein
LKLTAGLPMSRLKGLLLFILGGLLLLFALQNWSPPNPPVKMFGYEILPLPQGLIIYVCLLLGFVAGWLGHGMRLRKKKRSAASAEEKAEPY